ncbi:MAG TPA: suppressor of fused domain protein [Pyrinomonadaceae bacterium]
MRHLDAEEKLDVAVLSCTDAPWEGVTTHCTIGLSDYPMYQDDEEFPTRLEIVGACASDVEWFANLMSSSAFYVMRTGWLCHPGVVLANSVEMYAPELHLKHLYFTTPFLWEGRLETLELPTKKVAWLLAVMITEAEYLYLNEHGDQALESLFEEAQIDIFDINRPSAA